MVRFRRLRAGLSILIRRYWNGLLRGRRNIGVLLGMIVFLPSTMKIVGQDLSTVLKRAEGEDCPHARPIEDGELVLYCLFYICFIQHTGGVLSDTALGMHAHQVVCNWRNTLVFRFASSDSLPELRHNLSENTNYTSPMSSSSNDIFAVYAQLSNLPRYAFRGQCRGNSDTEASC